MAAFTDSTLQADRERAELYIKARARALTPNQAFAQVWGNDAGIGFARSSLARHREIEFHRAALVALGEPSWASYTWPTWNFQTATSWQFP